MLWSLVQQCYLWMPKPLFGLCAAVFFIFTLSVVWVIASFVFKVIGFIVNLVIDIIDLIIPG